MRVKIPKRVLIEMGFEYVEVEGKIMVDVTPLWIDLGYKSQELQQKVDQYLNQKAKEAKERKNEKEGKSKAKPKTTVGSGVHQRKGY
ncbi:MULTISPECIES: hypothetical protein [Anaerostipes]|uniref:hypothetical protein n=1 Tax=Anaerostipes TaxID=207244 RepID=UPI000E510CB3|nr:MULTISPECIES: hypothetical protein [Anaerostipes]RGH23184.1 hypothetical protein DWV34_08625 [Anaerostipes sp. AF04-45]